jgi:hypothetical protein
MAIDLPRTLSDLGRVIRDTFPKNIVLSSDIPDDLRPLRGDPTQMH